MELSDKLIEQIKKEAIDRISIPIVVSKVRDGAYAAIARKLSEVVGVTFQWDQFAQRMVVDVYSFERGELAREIQIVAKGEAQDLLARLREDKELFVLNDKQLAALRSHAKKTYVEALRAEVGEVARKLASDHAARITSHVLNTEKPATEAG